MAGISAAPPRRIERLRIRHSESGPDGLLKLDALFDFLQNAAACHAEELGVGMSSLYRNRMIWVLSRIKVAVDRYPAIDEEITLTTWPSGVERLFALRQFTAVDASGRPFARASSCWLVLDADTQKPLKAADVIAAVMPGNLDAACHFPGLDKLPRPDAALPAAEYTVRHSEIDVNRHLNNAVYADYATDAACRLAGGFARIGAIQINFVRAASAGDRIAVTGRLDGGNFLLSGDSPEGACRFQAAGTLAE